MPMSKEDWAEVEQALKSFYNTVELDCDGYFLSLRLVRTDTFRNAIVFYVNGRYLGKWALDDCEERRRFHRPMQISAYPKKYRAILKKMNKRQRQIVRIDPDKKITYHSGQWTSFAALRRHLTKHNTDISLIREGQKKEAAA